MHYKHSSNPIGTEIVGFDLATRFDKAAFARLKEIFYERSVVCLRDQKENDRSLGATRFASAWAAYAGLTPALKQRIENLKATHRVVGRRSQTGTGEQDKAEHERQPVVIHPLVRVHPHARRKYLFVSKGECERVIGLDEAEGLKLIEALADEITRPEYQYEHNWRVGDLLMWDNRAVQHIASFDYQWPEHRRLMHRVSILPGGDAGVLPSN